MKIGFITLGQTPREDVIPEILSLVGKKIEILEMGALDNLSQKEIERLKPEKEDFPLLTRLRNGSAVVIGKRNITPLVQDLVKRLDKAQVDFSILLCTETFPGLRSVKLLLQPSKILIHAVLSLLDEGRILVLSPLKEQMAKVEEKWKKTALEVTTSHLNPYARLGDLKHPFLKLENKALDLVVLDCIGYNLKIKKMVKEIIRKPVILPRTILGRIIQEIIEE